jgi:hypothetical protein
MNGVARREAEKDPRRCEGIQRGNRQRFPYEPRVIGGKLLMPAELQAIHRYVVETPVLETPSRRKSGQWWRLFLN